MNSFLQMMYNVEGMRNRIMSLDLKSMTNAETEAQKKDKKSLIMRAIYHL